MKMHGVKLLSILILFLGLAGCSGGGLPTCGSSSVAGGRSTDLCLVNGIAGQQTGTGTINFGKVRAISTGDTHTCAILTDRTVKCWGRNFYGQLGDGTQTNRATPTAVLGITNAKKIVALPAEMTCAILSDKSVTCWGFNGNWPLDFLRASPQTKPVPLAGVAGAIDLAGGYTHACAVLEGGTISCWGDCSSGQCGDGIVDSEHYMIPPTINGTIAGAVSISANDQHTCVRLSDGTVKCFGIIVDPISSIKSYIPSPELIKYESNDVLTNVVGIASGPYNNFCILSEGTALSWGMSSGNNLGNSTNNRSNSNPLPIIGITNPRNISAGYIHTCAAMWDGTIMCWGNNSYGQLGIGSEGGEYSSPVQVQGITNAVSVSAGMYTTCALTSEQEAYCWGLNTEGQLGNGTNTNSALPIHITGL